MLEAESVTERSSFCVFENLKAIGKVDNELWNFSLSSNSNTQSQAETSPSPSIFTTVKIKPSVIFN